LPFPLACAAATVGRTRATDAQRYELQRVLHGLEAITRLHFAQEEEIYRLLKIY
jgi:hypothetical protein